MGTAAVARLSLLALSCSVVAAFPEQGRYSSASSELVLKDEAGGYMYGGFRKTMYTNTNVTARAVCTSGGSSSSVTVQLFLVRSSCYNEQFVGCSWSCLVDKQPAKSGRQAPKSEPSNAAAAVPAAAAAATTAAATTTQVAIPNEVGCCNDGYASDVSKSLEEPKIVAASKEVNIECTLKATGSIGSRRRREDAGDTAKQSTSLTSGDRPLMPGEICTAAPSDGVYYVLVRAKRNSQTSKEEDRPVVSVEYVDAKSSYGYLSAVDWPNYYFYMIMVILYIFLQIVWLVMMACNWRDLIRVQYYIGAVILLGMIEKAVLLAEYENINKSGNSIKGAVIFAQIVSCMKRALSRVLIIIVCLGYGIVKPRLGPTLQKVLAAGIVYFVVATIEGCIRIMRDDYDTNGDIIAAVALVVVEVGICWWIFTSLVQTYRTLRLRRNLVKLTVYRHFANSLIFSVLVSLGFIGWFLYAVRFSTCVSDLRELWLEEGFWQMLFTLLLLIVIILWRPSANNQRYAFAPLLEAGEEGEEDENYSVVMGETFTGTKQRAAQGNDSQKKGKDKEYRAEDDLKWIEENIPTTALADKVLTVDSDEERATARNEISKMD